MRSEGKHTTVLVREVKHLDLIGAEEVLKESKKLVTVMTSIETFTVYLTASNNVFKVV